MVREDKGTWKANYFTKIGELFDEYPKCFVVGLDNVGSNADAGDPPFNERSSQAVILMGKNTMIIKAIRAHMAKIPSLEILIPSIVKNVGFVFTKEDLSDIRDKLLENRKAAPAKAGSIAPCDVNIPPQNTGMGPEKTSFFQALQISTKIARGSIEILNEAALLNMMRMTPFSYGLVILQVYENGRVYYPRVFSLSISQLRSRFVQGVRNVAAVSLALKYPTAASITHSITIGLHNWSMTPQIPVHAFSLS